VSPNGLLVRICHVFNANGSGQYRYLNQLGKGLNIMQPNQSNERNEPLRLTERGRLRELTVTNESKVTSLLLVLFVASCASLQAPRSAVEVPAKLKPGANESLAMIVPAKGVQIYECRARKDQSGGYEWVFVAPEAGLFDARGNTIGRHYAGPHWESTDGSKVVGTVKERADAPAANAIPWLLLVAKPVGAEGSFSKITSIQRVNTAGGVAPEAGCSQAAVGTSVRVAYTADYNFFTPSRRAWRRWQHPVALNARVVASAGRSADDR